MRIEDEITTRLRAAFRPGTITVRDESEAHRGHAGYQSGGGSHFHVTIRAPVFAGMTQIARHRAVHAALGAAILSRIHALRLDLAG